MSECQTLSMQNNATENTNLMQQSQFKEVSVKDESLHNFDMSKTPQQQHQIAMKYFNHYEKIDEAFPLITLKQSSNLRVKQYRQSTFYGQMQNGKKHGFGVMTYKNKRIYEGEWTNDKKKGFGCEKFANGCYYKGVYQNGKPNGAGCYTWPNGEYYDGEWINGFKHGSGMWRGYRGDSYKGEWKFGKSQGYGVYTWINGDKYEGQFKECLKHGEGIERFSNGDMYKGSYVNGKPSGYGEYYWSHGSYFKGNFINGLRDGRGSWKKGVGSSDRYDGEYRNDKKWGEGVFIWASGNVYKGQYEADMRSGYGEMHWVNGSYYKGNWKNGIQNGEGQIYIPNEGYKKGIFEDNKLIEVWEQRITNKPNNLKNPVSKQKRRYTQQNAENFSMRNRQKTQINVSNNKGSKTQMKQYLVRERTRGSNKDPMRMKSEEAGREPAHYFKKASMIQKDEKSFFSKNDRDKLYQRQQLKELKEKIQSISSKNMQNKDRLLHSSFYLYKLNMRHNVDTQKSLQRSQNQNVGKGGLLFKGKLLPNDI